MLNFGNKEVRNLQEQVLKNAQDIETLKGREDLQIVIVNELPEVGNPSYIYLVAKDDGESPNVYDEYIWLEDEERYELIGGVSIDLTNYVTLDSEQSITGVKTISNGNKLIFSKSEAADYWIRNGNGSVDFGTGESNTIVRFSTTNGIQFDQDVKAFANNSKSLGDSNYKWKDLYISGKICAYDSAYPDTNYWHIFATNQFNLMIAKNGTNRFMFQQNQFSPTDYQNPQCNLGSANFAWKDLYLTGNISDGANTVSVANIASKVTSTQASGTFDSNGQSTIDISGGTPEGLFIFSYGNCQCFLRLTAAMVQDADVTPIRVSCPMITSGSPYLGWLEIERSSNTLTISVKDGNIHVDSGFAWTLTKTNLL